MIIYIKALVGTGYMNHMVNGVTDFTLICFCQPVSLCSSCLNGLCLQPFCAVSCPSDLRLLYIARRAAGVVLVWLGSVVHLPHDLGEQFVHHGFALGRGLHEGAAPLLGQGLPLPRRHLPLAL